MNYNIDMIENWKICNNPSKNSMYISTGTGFAYHGITFGFYIDQLLQLADPQKRRVDKLLIEEIAKPFSKYFLTFVIN